MPGSSVEPVESSRRVTVPALTPAESNCRSKLPPSRRNSSTIIQSERENLTARAHVFRTNFGRGQREISFYFRERDIVEAQTGVVQCELALEISWRFGRSLEIELDSSLASQISQRRKASPPGSAALQFHLLTQFRQIQRSPSARMSRSPLPAGANEWLPLTSVNRD